MRKIQVLHSWLFRKGEFQDVAAIDFDDSDWKTVEVPHDWAIQGPFHLDYDAQCSRIVNNGEQVESWHYGRTGALPHIGHGAYRIRLNVPVEDAAKAFRLEFDGVMSHAKVYVNNTFVKEQPFGYTSFSCDVTEFIRPGAENIVCVTAYNPPKSSRWYPGAGIYREARFLTLDKVHIPYNGIWIRTQSVASDRAGVTILAEGPAIPFRYEIRRNGCVAAAGNGVCGLPASAEIANPDLWSPDSPALYEAVVTLDSGDCEVRKFGIRTVEFDAEKGMTLNGRPIRMNGVCQHHDLGPFGAAFHPAAARRSLRILQSIGVNALRTSHNPPAPGLLDLCDEMGILVMDETFDCWRMGKIANDYHTLFDEWHERDLEAMVKRDRNHPCVVLWSIGNEILEQQFENNDSIAKELTALFHKLDPDRKVTAGLSFDPEAITSGIAAAVDVPGFNYKPHRYEAYREMLPGKPIYGSETSSTVSSRGEYFFPLDEGYKFHTSNQCSSYDLEFPPWASTPDKEFHAQATIPWIMGEFVWTGFDYLGEPTPYDFVWPARSSYFGIFDLAGLPKDRAWLYKSRWSAEPTLHILPHWTFPTREGLPTPVHVYTSFEEVELFLNGKSLGRRRKNGAFRLRWDDVTYTPGELKAVAFDADGKEAMTAFRRTASAPVKLLLEPEENRPLEKDGDLMFLRVTAVDAAGTPDPLASFRVRFKTTGPVRLRTLCNGDATSLELFTQNHMNLFHGQLVASLCAVEGEGPATLTAEAENEFGSFKTVLEIPLK